MHLFAIAADLPSLSCGRIAQALAPIADAFGLDPATAWQASSARAAVAAAGVHHGERAAPRRYLVRVAGAVTGFDGLPVDPTGAHAAYDAHELARGWDGWAADLEGQFCAFRIDLEAERLELRLDTLGLVPIFVAKRDGGLLASNSVAAIRSLLGLSEPDPLGVSSMIGLGWAANRHTLLSGVAGLAGGAAHVVERGRLSSRVRFGPAQIRSESGRRRSGLAGSGVRRSRAAESVEELAVYMAELTASAARGLAPVRCAITAGRDSRLALALVRARGIDAHCYTIGSNASKDVEWAQALARHFALEHEVLVPRAVAEDEWEALATRLIFQADGLSDLRQLMDGLHPDGARALGVRISGIGGEIGRNGPSENIVAIANVPLLGRLPRLQRRVLRMKGDAFRHLMTRAAQEAVDRATDEFFERRLAEGWRPNEVADLFFAFERVGCHAATAPRRASGADDLFTPYCTRRYIEHCLTMTPAQRFVELPYQQLLRAVSPELAEFPFKDPLKRPWPALAGVRALRRLAQVGSEKAGVVPRKHVPATGEEPFLLAWLESQRGRLDELFAQDSSPLWEFVERERVRELMVGPPRRRAANLVGLLRVATLFWYFHGSLPGERDARSDAALGTPCA